MQNFPQSAKGTFCFQTTGLLPESWHRMRQLWLGGWRGKQMSAHLLIVNQKKWNHGRRRRSQRPRLMSSEKSVFCRWGVFSGGLQWAERWSHDLTYIIWKDRQCPLPHLCVRAHWPRGLLWVGNSSVRLTSAAYTSRARCIHIYTQLQRSLMA